MVVKAAGSKSKTKVNSEIQNSLQIEISPETAKKILHEKDLAIDIRKNGKPVGQFLNTYQLSTSMVIRHTRWIFDGRINIYHIEMVDTDIPSIREKLTPGEKRRLTWKMKSFR